MSINYNIDIGALDIILKERYNEKIVNLIKNFLLEFIDKDINFLDEEDEGIKEKNTKYLISLIEENGAVVGVKVNYIPIKVLPELDYYNGSKDYKAYCRRVLFDEKGEFKLENCDINFEIFAPSLFNQQLFYGIEITRQIYDSSGVMVSKNFGIIKQVLKKLDFSNFVLISEQPYSINNFSKGIKNDAVISPIVSYSGGKNNLIENELDLKKSIIEINYDELFEEGFDVFKFSLEEGFDNEKVMLLVDCVRISHDVAFIKILKALYRIPSKFEAYFKLSDAYFIRLPDISFCEVLNHKEYVLDYIVDLKCLDECGLELEEAVKLGFVDEEQKNFLLRLCQINSRDNISSETYSYGKARSYGRT